MKVAILLSGQARNFKQGYEELKKTYLDKYDCDVYFHTWKGNYFKASQFFFDRPPHEYHMNGSWEDELISLYSPKKFLIEEQIVFDNTGYIDPVWRQPLQNTKAMWYSVMKAFSLVDSSYDFYIRTRFDLRYEESTARLEDLTLRELNVWDWNTDVRVKNRGYYDVFAVGSYNTVGIYSELYNRLDWYLKYDKDYRNFLQGDSGLRNEYLLKWHLVNSGVPVFVNQTSSTSADGQIIR